MIKAVIYDFDGTLIETLKVSFDAYNSALSRLGINATEEEIINKCFNKLDSEVAKSFNISLELFSKYYKEATIKGYKNAELYPNVISTFKEIKKLGISVAIGTSKDMNKIAEVLDRIKIKEYCEVIITNDSGLRKKPEIFSEVCKKLKIKPEEVIIVGDAENDLDAANNINAKSVLFYPKSHEKYYRLKNLNKFKPDFIIKNHNEIINILEKLM